MDPKELIRAGRLSEARKVLIETVKASPSDGAARTVLFQVQCFLGEWDKAERQLEVVASQSPKSEAGVQGYRNLLAAEKFRADVFSAGLRPSFLPKTPAYAEKYFGARELIAQEEWSGAAALFDEIVAQIPELAGTLNGKEFSDFGDMDSGLSFFLETFVHGKYVWVPFESVREIVVSPPQTLFDLLWISALVTTHDGLSLNCFLPVLYPGSSRHEDDRVKLGRMTDWVLSGGSFVRGAGQHVYEVGGEEVPLLEMREVVFGGSTEERNHGKED